MLFNYVANMSNDSIIIYILNLKTKWFQIGEEVVPRW